ncbi:hypothetical protein LXL04_026708 [Taraxacum kok-saghyz]
MYKHEIRFHIQEEIMKRLPVKSLLQFRTVSKTWKSLIDSSDFITAHIFHRHTQQHHLLASYANPMDETQYVSFIDDDTLPKQRSIHTLPPFLKQLIHPEVVGSSHGLFCLYDSNAIFTTKMVVLWNPSIRKLVVVDMPNKEFIGFGLWSFEKFEVIQLPDSLARPDLGNLYTSKLRGSLAILKYKDNIISVWMMDHGVEISFTKLFTIETPPFVIGFRNSGVPIMQVTNDDDGQSKLVVYEPKSKHKHVIETSDSHYAFYVNTYMETLLLQGRYAKVGRGDISKHVVSG